MLSAEEMASRKFGKLRMKFPKAILPGSNKKEIWICDCGKEKLIKISRVIQRNGTTSCGRCNEISEEEMKIRKFGKLRMKNPQAISPGSHKKETWICDCGREIKSYTYSITSGYIVSCGRCNEISEEEMKIRKFGKLRMKNPKSILFSSDKRKIWICDCGKEKEIIIKNVVRGLSKSCGDCHNSIYDWYLKNVEKLQSLKCPIQPENFPSGGLAPLEVIEKVTAPFKCGCALCGKIYHPRFSDIKLGKSLTCGCGSYRISSGQKDISLFIESLGFETKLEYSVNKLKYDIFVPSANLLIEYDGSHWHSLKGSKERDERKERTALDYGYVFLRITEEEWLKNRKRVENQLSIFMTGLN